MFGKKKGESSSGRNLSPRFRVNTDSFTHVDETSFMSHPTEFNSQNENKILNRYYNFEEDLDEKVEIENYDEPLLVPQRNYPQPQEDIPPSPTYVY